jgi:hypothetical protein
VHTRNCMLRIQTRCHNFIFFFYLICRSTDTGKFLFRDLVGLEVYTQLYVADPDPGLQFYLWPYLIYQGTGTDNCLFCDLVGTGTGNFLFCDLVGPGAYAQLYVADPDPVLQICFISLSNLPDSVLQFDLLPYLIYQGTGTGNCLFCDLVGF